MSETTTEAHVTHQRVGWLELFYDLVFVAVIERLTHLLHDDPHIGRIFATIGLTLLCWFSWFNVTALTNVRGGIGPRGRPFMFVSMAGVGVLALGVEPVVEGHPWLFALGYAIARTAVWPLWWQRDPGSAQWRKILWGPILSVAWLLTPLVPDHVIGWALGVLALAEMNLTMLRPEGADHHLPRINGPHMVERLGLFLMIVLGESVVQIVNSLDTERTALTWVTAGLAMAMMCALWWLIYEATVEKAEQAVEQPDANALDFIGGSQLGIVAGLVLMAAGVADAIHTANPEHGDAHLHHGSLTCLCLGLVMAHIGTRSLTKRAFAINLGITRPKRPSREERQQQRAEQIKEHEKAVAEGRHTGPTLRNLLALLTQGLTYLVPVVLVWFFGDHWAPWVIVLVLLSYVVLALITQGYGERRIRAFVESTREDGVGAGPVAEPSDSTLD